MPFSVLFREALSHPYISFFHLLMVFLLYIYGHQLLTHIPPLRLRVRGK